MHATNDTVLMNAPCWHQSSGAGAKSMMDTSGPAFSHLEDICAVKSDALLNFSDHTLTVSTCGRVPKGEGGGVSRNIGDEQLPGCMSKVPGSERSERQSGESALQGFSPATLPGFSCTTTQCDASSNLMCLLLVLNSLGPVE